MYLVLIAWLYVALMMAVAEATNTTGSLLGALITFVLYGLLPMSVVLYLMGSPARRRALKAKEAAERAEVLAAAAAKQASDPTEATPRPTEAAPSNPPDASRQATGMTEAATVASVREEKR